VYGRLQDLIEPDFDFPQSLCHCKVIPEQLYRRILDEEKFCKKLEMLLEIMCKKLRDKGVHDALEESRQLHVSNYINFNGGQSLEQFTCDYGKIGVAKL
jgi:hypothetical protein